MLRTLLVLAAFVVAACVPTGPSVTAPPDAVVVTASGESFTTPAVTVSAAVPFTIFFEIQDGSQHDLHLWQGATSLAATEIFGGPSARTLEVGPLDRGEYQLACDIHPSMRAALEAV
jgi:plastocyanin